MGKPNAKSSLLTSIQIDQHTPMDVFVDGELNPELTGLGYESTSTVSPGRYSPMANSAASLDQYAKWGGVVAGVGSAIQGAVTSYYSSAIQKDSSGRCKQSSLAITLAKLSAPRSPR